MRTEPTDVWSAALARLRAAGSGLRRGLARLGPAGRLALVLIPLGAAGLIGYLITQPATSAFATLYAGHRFAAAELTKRLQVLSEAGFEAQSVDGRIAVDRTRLTEAYTALRKAGLQPRSLEDLVEEWPRAGLLATSAEFQLEQNRYRERLVEAAIREIDPALTAIVQIHRTPPRGLRRASDVRATVWLKVESQRRIPPDAIERIRRLVPAWIPDLATDGLTLLDSTGQPYVLAGNPAVAARSALEAREEELRGVLLERLDWIEGVRVAVSLEAEASMPPPVEPAPAAGPSPPSSAPAVSINQPFEDEAEPAREGPVVAAPAPALEEPATALAPERPAGRARILVQVPNTYYTGLAAATEVAPSLEKLHAIVRDTETSIRRSVELAIPDAERGEVLIGRIFVPGPARAANLTPATTSPWSRSKWAAAGTGAVMAGLALAATVFALAAGQRQRRREARRQRRRVRTPTGRSLHIDLADVPAPTDRVRELVRLDPAAAAGVLQRWIGGGGQDS